MLYAGIVYFLYIILCTYTADPIWGLFADSNDYKIQSQYSLFSIDFYSPKPQVNMAPRPFTVPLFYKLVTSDPYKMVLLQKIIYAISILTLVFSFLNYLSAKFLKISATYLLLYFFTWWNIAGWSNNILSESLSISFMFLWFAMILFYYKKQSLVNLVLLIGISIFLSFTRDTWPYIILLFSIINLLLFVLFKNQSLKKNCVFLIFSVVLFFSQNYTSSVGERYKLPVFNSIAGRIAQNDEYIKWFKNEGMPLSENMVKDFRGIDIDDETNRSLVYAKYSDASYKELFKWITKDGKASYQKFLATHLSYFFLKDQTTKQKDRIFCSNLFGYTLEPKGFHLNADGTFPYFSLSSTIIFLCILMVVIAKHKSEILFFPLLLFILFSVNALISYNADALEVKRHLFITQIILDFTNIISLFLIINFLSDIFKYSKHHVIAQFREKLQLMSIKQKRS